MAQPGLVCVVVYLYNYQEIEKCHVQLLTGNAREMHGAGSAVIVTLWLLVALLSR